MPVSVIGYEASNSIVELSTTELDKLSYYILEYMIAGGDFAGTLTANALSTGNLIGTFVDTARVGDEYESNITIVSNSTNLYQSNTQIFTTVPYTMTVGLNTAPVTSVILEENKTTLSALGQEIFDRYTSNGPGTYYLGIAAPVDGGTWGYDYFIDDTLFNFTVQNARYYLWKKLEQNYSGTHIEPLKLTSNVLTRFSDAEIKLLAYYVENIFLTTGVGQYALQTSPPAYGTWVNQGTITDIRKQETIGDFEGPLYDAEYISSYEGILETSYDAPVTLFSGYVGFGSFLNPDEATFSTDFTSGFNTSYTGYIETYVENRIINYLGPGLTYEGDLGPEYDGAVVLLSNYDGFTNVTYEGIGFTAFDVGVGDFINPNEINFVGNYTGNFVSVFAGYQRNYTGTNLAYYNGPGPAYEGAILTDDYIAGYDLVTNPFLASYDNVYAGDYNLEGSPYIAEFINISPEEFSGGTFAGFTSFINPNEINFQVTYSGNFASSFAGYVRNYVGQSADNYLGPSIDYTSPANYDLSFIGLYEGNFEDSYIATYTGEYDVSYTADYIATFSATYTATYEGVGFNSYFSTAPAVYEGDSTIGYQGPTVGFTAFNDTFISEFQELYSGPAVSELTETVTTLTLWRRIA